MKKKNPVLRYNDLVIFYILGPSRNPCSYFWIFFSSSCSLVFLSLSFLSYVNNDFIVFPEELYNSLPFIPESLYLPFYSRGMVIGLYGILSGFWTLYLLCIVIRDVGGGYDMFDKKEQKIEFGRWGFFKDFTLEIPMKESLSLRLVTHTKTDFFNRTFTYEILYLETENNGFIPLTRLEYDLLPIDIAWKASELSRFLKLPVYW
uniref:Photosystem I assembly protein Ycf4 n=1 Tax=Grona barbata TaxID=556501 RepID=C0J3H2_9FABA|nr:Ycf4 [Grona barbata]